VATESLWAPWRLAYIVSEKPQQPDECFLCRSYKENKDDENLLVERAGQAVTVLNRFPYNNGHLLVSPSQHKATLEELNDDELLDCMRAIRRMTILLGKVMAPDGYNVGLNLGRAAGAGHPGHLHWHIVPRWSGDTNFMPILGDVSVIPQSLQALYELLRKEIASKDS